MLPSSEAVTPPRARAALSSCFTVGFVFRFVTPCRIGYWFRPLEKFLDRDPVIPQISNQCHTVHRRAMPTLLRGRTKTPRQGSADTHTHTLLVPRNQTSETEPFGWDHSACHEFAACPATPRPAAPPRPPGRHEGPCGHRSPHQPIQDHIRKGNEARPPGVLAARSPATFHQPVDSSPGLPPAACPSVFVGSGQFPLSKIWTLPTYLRADGTLNATAASAHLGSPRKRGGPTACPSTSSRGQREIRPKPRGERTHRPRYNQRPRAPVSPQGTAPADQLSLQHSPASLPHFSR